MSGRMHSLSASGRVRRRGEGERSGAKKDARHPRVIETSISLLRGRRRAFRGSSMGMFAARAGVGGSETRGLSKREKPSERAMSLRACFRKRAHPKRRHAGSESVEQTKLANLPLSRKTRGKLARDGVANSRLIATGKTRDERIIAAETRDERIKRDTIYGHATPKTKRDFYLARAPPPLGTCRRRFNPSLSLLLINSKSIRISLDKTRPLNFSA